MFIINWKIQETCSEIIKQDEFKNLKAAEPLISILYTSGSTGVPKGVRVSQKATMNRLVWQWNTFPYSKNEVNLCSIPFFILFIYCWSLFPFS